MTAPTSRRGTPGAAEKPDQQPLSAVNLSTSRPSRTRSWHASHTWELSPTRVVWYIFDATTKRSHPSNGSGEVLHLSRYRDIITHRLGYTFRARIQTSRIAVLSSNCARIIALCEFHDGSLTGSSTWLAALFPWNSCCTFQRKDAGGPFVGRWCRQSGYFEVKLTGGYAWVISWKSLTKETLRNNVWRSFSCLSAEDTPTLHFHVVRRAEKTEIR